MTDWLTSAFGFKIERINVPHSSERIHPPVPAGVLHTTEGSWEGSLSVFKQHYAPHFMVGRDKTGKVRIAQFCPLGYMSAALEHTHAPETNRWASAQIELVAHSSQQPWSVGPDVEAALAALMAKLQQECGIKLRRPFSDQMPPTSPPWASENFSRRKAGFWGKFNGWYGHVEIPGNAHWDPGAYRWGPLLARASAILAPPKPPPPHAVKYKVTVEKPLGNIVKSFTTEKPGPDVHDLGIVAKKYDKVLIRRIP